MPGNETGAARKAADQAAISSGESSASREALNSGQQDPSPPGAYDVTLAPVSRSSLDATVAPASLNMRMMANIGAVVLEVGTVIGERYEIEKLLGMGGMGAVYRARDRELDRAIGLKIIRPDLAGDPEILARFKRELILARQVTHRNIIRIFDLNEADGLKFITMEYIDGEDLRSIFMREGKLAPETAVQVILQVCRGLAAAHSEGVIHRDLKPSNIMRDGSGRVVVMDFGLARTAGSDGMTKTGLMIGTIEYMSPEQALGAELDARSDLFAVGLIFYEALSGNIPFKADSAIASLVKRTTEKAKSLRESDTEIPEGLSDIVGKCLEREPDNRYASAVQIIEDLEAWLGKRAPTHALVPSVVMPAPAAPVSPRSVVAPAATLSRARFPKWLLIACLVIVLAAAGSFAGWKYFHRGETKVAHAPVSVLVADFENHTGDPVLDGTLEPMINVALEGGQFINAYNRGRARSLAQKLPVPTSKLDEQSARLVALSQGVSAVITGQISRRGNNYAVSAMALDAATGNVLANSETLAKSQDALLRDIPKLIAPIRNALGDATPESAQLVNSSGAFTAASAEVVHQYSIGMEQQFAGNVQGALQSFEKATSLDPSFARAYAGMASASLKLNRLQDADKYINEAMQHVDRMTDRERFRVRGFYYFTTENWQKCSDEYTDLVGHYPGDNIAHNNLGVCLSKLRKLPQAAEQAKLDLQNSPNATAAANLSLLTTYAGDYQEGERKAREMVQKYPSFEFGDLALAFAQLGQGQLQEGEQTYRALEKLSPLGANLADWGLADLATYEGRFAEANKMLERGAAADLAAKNPDSAAERQMALAMNQLWLGHDEEAVATADKALVNSQAVKIRFLAGRVFAQAGKTPKADKLVAGLAAEISSEPQAYAKIISGDIAMKRGASKEAIQAFTDANRLLDTWIGHFDLGRAYLDGGMFVEADGEFDACIKRRGEALSLFLDQVPTFGVFPPVYYYQGRAREGLKSTGAADSYRIYLTARGAAGEDPLLTDVRSRLK